MLRVTSNSVGGLSDRLDGRRLQERYGASRVSRLGEWILEREGRGVFSGHVKSEVLVVISGALKSLT